MIEEEERIDRFVSRSIHHLVIRHLNEFRAVMLHGARQSGKSTIVRQLARERNAVYANLDFPAQLEAARAEPSEFVVGIEVKATTSPGRNAARGLISLRNLIDRSGGRFIGGYVLHMGPGRCRWAIE